jgi:hypothetical protein
MTMLTWLRSLFTRPNPAPARRPGRAAQDTERMPAWQAAGGSSGRRADAVTPANAAANLETLKMPVIDIIRSGAGPDR